MTPEALDQLARAGQVLADFDGTAWWVDEVDVAAGLARLSKRGTGGQWVEVGSLSNVTD